MPFYPSLPPNLLAQLNLGAPNASVQPPPASFQPPPVSAPDPAATAAPAQQSEPGFWAKLGQRLANPQLVPGMRNPTREEMAAAAANAIAHPPPVGPWGGPLAPQDQAQPQPQASTAGPTPSVDWNASRGQDVAPQMPAARTVPAHEVSTISPTAQGKFDAAGTEKRAAAEESGQAEIGANQAQAGALEGVAANMDRLNAEAASKEDARRKAFEDQAADVKKLRDEAAAGKPDYDRWWKDRGTGGRVVGAIAQALGAAGASLGHTQNFAMEIINRQIDADIMQQRDAITQKGERAKGAAEDLRVMRERFGDERAADAALKAQELEKYKLRGQAMVQQAQSPMLKAKWDGVMADIDQEQAKLYAHTHQWFQAATVGGGPSSAVSDVKPDEVMQLRDGRYVTVPTADRDKVVQAETTAQSVAAAGQDARKLLSVPTLQRGPEWMSAYKAAQKTLAAAEIEGGGRGGKGMFEQFQKAQEGSWRFLTLTPGANAAIDQVVRGANERRESAIAQSAQYEVRPTLVQNPKTGIVERKHIIVRPFERPRAGAAPQVTPAGDEK